LTTLMAYYNTSANQTGTNTLTWAANGATYTVYFAGPPRPQWQGGFYVVEVDLVEA
jgi:hypothetical protein